MYFLKHFDESALAKWHPNHRMHGSGPVPLSAGLLPRNLGAFLSGLGEANGDRLFSTLYHSERRIALLTVLLAAFPYLAIAPPISPLDEPLDCRNLGDET
jgi:hypothetical protein